MDKKTSKMKNNSSLPLESSSSTSSEDEVPEKVQLHCNSYSNAHVDSTVGELPWDEQIIEAYHGMKKISFNVSLPETDGCKYFIMKIPKCIDPNLLLSKKIKLHKPSNIVIDKDDYCVLPDKSDTPIPINIGNSKFISTEDIITVQQILPSIIPPLEDLHSNVEILESKVELPEEIKTRHPLLGADYKEKLKIDKDIINKILKAEEKKIKYLKKQSKKKAKPETKYNESLMDILAINTASSASFSQIKNEFDNMGKQWKENNLEQNSQSTQEPQQSGSKKKNKNKEPMEIGDFSINDSMSFETFKARKQTNNGEINPKKKHKREQAILNSTTNGNNLHDLNMVPTPIKIEFDNERKEKKKKKKKELSQEEIGRSDDSLSKVPKPLKQELISTSNNDDDVHLPKPIEVEKPKKHKRKKDEIDVMTQIETEQLHLNGVIKKKKKEKHNDEVPQPIKITLEDGTAKSKATSRKTKNDLIQESLQLVMGELKGQGKTSKKDKKTF